MVAFGLEKIASKLHALKSKKLPLSRDFDAVNIFSNAHQNFESCFLLESAQRDAQLGRFSLLGFNPKARISISKGKATVFGEDGAREEFDCKQPFEQLRALSRLIAKKCLLGKSGFAGGLVGNVCFDAAQYFDSAATVNAKGNTGFPDLEFGVYTDFVSFHPKAGVRYFSLGKDNSREVYAFAKETPSFEKCVYSLGKTNISDSSFEKKVGAAKEYVKAGDAFQIVLSRRQSLGLGAGKLSFYKALREINPSPYMYFVKNADRQIIGASPEMLVRCEENKVETFPIAGTRKRGKNAGEDLKMQKELLRDEKEKAEHLMLVDLARNDLGKVSSFGKVKVETFMQIKKFSHVQHLVSKVSGVLAKEKDCFDAFESTFPAGTVSGAPKIRAMEIISQLEECSRGPYAGAAGYFSFNSNCNFAIAIRTLFCNGNNAFAQAGAGIVYDSVPERELLETKNKAAVLFDALEKARGEKKENEEYNAKNKNGKKTVIE